MLIKYKLRAMTGLRIMKHKDMEYKAMDEHRIMREKGMKDCKINLNANYAVSMDIQQSHHVGTDIRMLHHHHKVFRKSSIK
ncbi:uncharacterized protein DS421_5g165490 [Arachis hypogaea]|nr:uncharacterized protein DS421_5g165490 [Arachis hypogaea]